MGWIVGGDNVYKTTGRAYRACVSFNEQLATAIKMLLERGFSSESEVFRQALIKLVKEEYPDIYEECFKIKNKK